MAAMRQAGNEAAAVSSVNDADYNGNPQVPRPTRAVPGENQMVQIKVRPMNVVTALGTTTRENLPRSVDEIMELMNFDTNAAWEKISSLLYRNVIPSENKYIDITDGSIPGGIFPWWLWISNLGNRSSEVRGKGIKEVYLSRTQAYEVLFIFIRHDNTQYCLFLGCDPRSVRTEVYTVALGADYLGADGMPFMRDVSPRRLQR